MTLERGHFGRQQVPTDRIEAGILLRLIVDLLKRKKKRQSNKSSKSYYYTYLGERNQDRTKRDAIAGQKFTGHLDRKSVV